MVNAMDTVFTKGNPGMSDDKRISRMRNYRAYAKLLRTSREWDRVTLESWATPGMCSMSTFSFGDKISATFWNFAQGWREAFLSCRTQANSYRFSHPKEEIYGKYKTQEQIELILCGLTKMACTYYLFLCRIRHSVHSEELVQALRKRNPLNADLHVNSPLEYGALGGFQEQIPIALDLDYKEEGSAEIKLLAPAQTLAAPSLPVELEKTLAAPSLPVELEKTLAAPSLPVELEKTLAAPSLPVELEETLAASNLSGELEEIHAAPSIHRIQKKTLSFDDQTEEDNYGCKSDQICENPADEASFSSIFLEQLSITFVNSEKWSSSERIESILNIIDNQDENTVYTIFKSVNSNSVYGDLITRVYSFILSHSEEVSGIQSIFMKAMAEHYGKAVRQNGCMLNMECARQSLELARVLDAYTVVLCESSIQEKTCKAINILIQSKELQHIEKYDDANLLVGLIQNIFKGIETYLPVFTSKNPKYFELVEIIQETAIICCRICQVISDLDPTNFYVLKFNRVCDKCEAYHQHIYTREKQCLSLGYTHEQVLEEHANYMLKAYDLSREIDTSIEVLRLEKTEISVEDLRLFWDLPDSARGLDVFSKFVNILRLVEKHMPGLSFKHSQYLDLYLKVRGIIRVLETQHTIVPDIPLDVRTEYLTDVRNLRIRYNEYCTSTVL